MRVLSQKDRAWLWLNSVVGANVSLADKLVCSNGGILELYSAAKNGKAIKVPEKQGEKLISALRTKACERDVDAIIEGLDRGGFTAVTRDSSDYPLLLREIFDPPTVLFVKGSLRPDLKLPIAVIGSRKCTDYGREMADFFGFELAENGACVISGMALGCDSVAAKAALRSNKEYPTVAVLGSGIDVIYPSSNAKLYSEIAERGAVISEYRPGVSPTRESFPQRNRLISGLSKGVLVIEAAKKSGTSITVGFAHDQGRDVFAVPGRLTDISSAGTNELIKSGAAKAVFGVDDVIYEYGVFLADPPMPGKRFDGTGLSPEQKRICEALLKGEKTVDILCEITGLSVQNVNTCLTELELSGIIKQLPNGNYGI
jgi:DNA processing protein